MKLHISFRKRLAILAALSLVACVPAIGDARAIGTDRQSHARDASIPQRLTEQESRALISKVHAAQARLRKGDDVYFELLSGAPASFTATMRSPRDVFLAFAFEAPITAERIPSASHTWRPYRLSYRDKENARAIWEVEVVLNINDSVQRVEMINKPPSPF